MPLRVNPEPLGFTRGLEPFGTLTALSLSKGLSKGKPGPLPWGVEGLTLPSVGFILFSDTLDRG